MFIRYELAVNDVPTGYGALVGAQIFGLIPNRWSLEYTSMLNVLPNPSFSPVEGFHCVSYFKDTPDTERFLNHVKGIIECGCVESSLESFIYTLKRIEVPALENIVYEDAFQVVVLVEGDSTYKKMYLDESMAMFDVQKQVLLEVIEKLYEANKM